MSVRLPSHVQYRNATYYGVIEQEKRNGHGLLVLDNSQILLGNALLTQLSGKTTLFMANTSSFPKTYVPTERCFKADLTDTISSGPEKAETHEQIALSMACSVRTNSTGRQWQSKTDKFWWASSQTRSSWRYSAELQCGTGRFIRHSHSISPGTCTLSRSF